MATFIVGGALALIVGGIVWKLIKDKRMKKGGCGGDCGHCSGGCH